MAATALENGLPGGLARILSRWRHWSNVGRHGPKSHELKERCLTRGYRLTEIEVITNDGYILTVHRLAKAEDDGEEKGTVDQNENETKTKTIKPVVFLQHGLKSSSADWTIGGLAFRLVDRGYDVFMGNFRGNDYSRRHKSLDPKTSPADFWNFSFDEHGTYDLPAMIDAALRVSGADRLHRYVGHSMGMTAFFVMLSMYPSRNQLFQGVVALAPVAGLGPNVSGSPSYFLSSVPAVVAALNAVDIHCFDFPAMKDILPWYSLLAALTCYTIGYHEMDPERAGELMVRIHFKKHEQSRKINFEYSL